MDRSLQLFVCLDQSTGRGSDSEQHEAHQEEWHVRDVDSVAGRRPPLELRQKVVQPTEDLNARVSLQDP